MTERMDQHLSDLVDEVTSLRYAGGVTRWHTMPHLGEQSVAEHSGQAVSLILMLHPNPSISLVKAMSWHDTAERHVGDVPAPVRRVNKEFSDHYERCEEEFMKETHPAAWNAIGSLTALEFAWLKAVDVLELIMYCGDQQLLGNSHAKVVQERAVAWLVQNARTPHEVVEFLRVYLAKGGARSYA